MAAEHLTAPAPGLPKSCSCLRDYCHFTLILQRAELTCLVLERNCRVICPTWSLASWRGRQCGLANRPLHWVSRDLVSQLGQRQSHLVVSTGVRPDQLPGGQNPSQARGQTENQGSGSKQGSDYQEIRSRRQIQEQNHRLINSMRGLGCLEIKTGA